MLRPQYVVVHGGCQAQHVDGTTGDTEEPIFLDLPRDADLASDRIVRISDHGLTLMRLSYAYDIDTPNKERIFHRILAENGVQEDDGELFVETAAGSLYPAILQFAHAISKICNMRQFKREVLASLFEEMLDEFIAEELGKYHPQKAVYPIRERDDLEADWEIKPNGVPLYLFVVKDTPKARLATISCLEFQRAHLKFKSIVVHEDFDKLGRKGTVKK